MVKKIAIWVVVLGASSLLLAGCMAAQYKKRVPGYEAKVQRLKDLGGELKAPYETAKAENYLKAYKHEVEEGDRKGAELFEKKLDKYIEQGLAKIP